MKYDDALSLLGDFGLYQRIMYVLLCLPIMFTSIQVMSPVFTLATPKHRCAIPGMLNDTYIVQNEVHRQLIDMWIPPADDDDGYSKCSIYQRENTTSKYYSFMIKNGDVGNASSLHNSSTVDYGTVTRQLECSRWVYDKSVFENTVVTETDLVCTRIIYRAHATTALNIGAVFSFVVMGQFSDRFGRKLASAGELVLMVVSSTLLVWLPNIYVFIVIRLFIGFGFGVFFNTIFVYAMEFIGPSKRTTFGVFTNHFWAFGMLLQALLAYGLRSWRHLQLATSLPILLFFGYWWRLPNSGRWMIANGHKEEGKQILQHMAKVNKVKLNIQELDLQVEDTDDDEQTTGERGTICTLFQHKALAIRSVVVFYNWLIIAMLYYGLSLNVGNLGGDIYVNFLSSAMMEVVGYTICIPAMVKLGRKTFHCGCLIAGGTVLLMTIIPVEFMSTSSNWVVTTLSMIGKLVSSAAYATVYLYSAELFPTVVRGTAMGMCAACATIGGIIAPYIVELANILEGNTAKIIPLIIFGVTSLVAGVVSLILPETGHMQLPDTIEDMKTTKKDKTISC